MLKLGGAVVSVLDGRAMKTYDYINQVNASVVDLQGYVDHSPPLVAMHHHDLACA